MFEQALVIARKEVVDHLREVRSLLASVMHLLMGPVLISLVLFSLRHAPHARIVPVIGGMAAIFLLVSVFTGGMNIAMDLVAGERERRSLLPLLLTPVSRSSIVMGKWLAITMFAVSGASLTFAALIVPFHMAAIPWPSLLRAGLALVPLAAFAAALQLTISTFCRTVKEAQTYLSLLIFLPMGIAMFMVFVAPASATWLNCLPILGQQALLMDSPRISLVTPTLLVSTAWCAGMALQYTATLLARDEIVYGR